jgi:hypothetical protein
MMTPEQSALWNQLAGFSFDDPGSAFPFSQRLALENGWSREFAARAIEEYRRFLFLSAVSGHLCTPSDEIDQVWHLHLCYTKSYWHDLCRDLLGREIHHGPTRGGEAEDTRYRLAYKATLASYRSLFNGDPPGALWPEVAERFDRRRRFRRVDLARSWVFEKPNPLRVFGVLVALGAISLAACKEDAFGDPMMPIYAFGVAASVGILAILIRAVRGGRGGRRSSRRKSGCGSCSTWIGGSSCGSGGADSGHDGDGNDGQNDGGGGGGSGCGSSCGSGCGGGGD